MYDVFWVFISPLIFHESVMIAVSQMDGPTFRVNFLFKFLRFSLYYCYNEISDVAQEVAVFVVNCYCRLLKFLHLGYLCRRKFCTICIDKMYLNCTNSFVLG